MMGPRVMRMAYGMHMRLSRHQVDRQVRARAPPVAIEARFEI
jgi:hypothetical protein